MSIVYLNGLLLPEEEARISPRDRGLLLGDSIFETMPVYSGRVFLLDRHLARLADSAAAVLLNLPCSSEDLVRAVTDTIEANGVAMGSVRLTVTRGVGPAGIDPLAETTPTVLVMTAAPRDLAPLKAAGVDVVISDVVRNLPAAVPCFAKTGNMLNNILGRAAASRAGAFEAVMLNTDGTVAEGTVSNVFAVIGGIVHTPPADGRILPGVTRGAVLEILSELNVAAVEQPFGMPELLSAEEIWLTNSLIEVLPVRSCAGRPLPGPWPVWQKVDAAYWAWVRRQC